MSALARVERGARSSMMPRGRPITRRPDEQRESPPAHDRQQCAPRGASEATARATLDSRPANATRCRRRYSAPPGITRRATCPPPLSNSPRFNKSPLFSCPCFFAKNGGMGMELERGEHGNHVAEGWYKMMKIRACKRRCLYTIFGNFIAILQRRFISSFLYYHFFICCYL